MSSQRTPPSTPPNDSGRRRASFSPGQQLSGIMNRSPVNTPGATNAFPGPIATAAANVQSRRRLSISTLGLSGSSPTQTSPFNNRRESMSSSTSGSTTIDENAIEEGDGPSAPASTPATPFARRMSFGARALRDVRGAGPNNEGFNWSEAIRSRAERSSIGGANTQSHAAHARAQTAAAIPSTHVEERPKPPNVPDAMQERILKGDFYMD